MENKSASEYRAQSRAIIEEIVHNKMHKPMFMLVGIYLAYEVVINALSRVNSVIAIVCLVINLVVGLPLLFGTQISLLKVARKEKIESADIINLPKQNWGRSILAEFLPALFTFFWTLLLIIPGLIKAYSYILTPFIAYDNPEMSISECMKKSTEMMKGHKMRLAILHLSFIGWILSCIIIIPALNVIPYICIANGLFYMELSGKSSSN